MIREIHNEDINDCLQDIATLKEQGKLFTEDTYEPLAGEFKERSGDVVKALAAGAHSVMVGSLVAGVDEAVGDRDVLLRGGGVARRVVVDEDRGRAPALDDGREDFRGARGAAEAAPEAARRPISKAASSSIALTSPMPGRRRPRMSR